jgi:hypothetical protein
VGRSERLTTEGGAQAPPIPHTRNTEMDNSEYTKAITDYLDNFVNDNKIKNKAEFLEEVIEAIWELQKQYAFLGE